MLFSPKSEKGQGLVEYALILLLVAVVVIAFIWFVIVPFILKLAIPWIKNLWENA